MPTTQTAPRSAAAAQAGNGAGNPAAKRRKLVNNLVAYSFIAPNFIGFAVFTLIPVIFAFVLAFLNWDGSTTITFAGLDNFTHLFADKNFKYAFRNTIIYTILTVPLTMVCSLGLAVLLNQKIRGRNFFRSVMFFPYVASLVAVAVVWNMIFNPSMGPVNMMLNAMGVAEQSLPGWSADKNWVMPTIIMFGVWKNMGYYMIIYLAGLQGISPELYEAASLDGANTWQKFRHVTIPQLRSTTFFVSIMVTIQCFKVFDQVMMLTNNLPGKNALVLVYHIYNTAFISWDLGYASAIAMVMFLLVLCVTLVQFYGEKKMN